MGTLIGNVPRPSFSTDSSNANSPKVDISTDITKGIQYLSMMQQDDPMGIETSQPSTMPNKKRYYSDPVDPIEIGAVSTH